MSSILAFEMKMAFAIFYIIDSSKIWSNLWLKGLSREEEEEEEKIVGWRNAAERPCKLAPRICISQWPVKCVLVSLGGIYIYTRAYIYISFRRIELVKRKRDENIVLTRVTAYYSVATCKRIPEDEPLPFRISLNDVYQARYNNFAIIFLSSYYIATSHAYGFLTDGLTSLK